jgi:hypothetical protein
MKKVTLNEILTPKQVAAAARCRTAREICDRVVAPNLQEINERLGQENDPMYLAYVIEFALGRNSHIAS